ncbi:uncharacterized protein KY384_003131 [Bacidia gigantensis]|uniref:uncharacterized protein n=1 Tax=Bacidia gigantensis TaxID=2732470 RepID=UPI001D03DB99|nr:uncharacterized protein KY384_003131 [Bacidia gigantensis]KAG8531502.1 hypothetical protein KY384_003131 [Bacidia gigantensis]
MRVLPPAVMLVPAIGKRQTLERRKDKTVTETTTFTQTLTINQTFTEHVSTTVFSTIFATITVPSTINHTLTVPTTTTVQATPSTATIARLAPELIALNATSGKAPPATASSPLPVASASKKDSLGTAEILAIVLGSLAFAGLLLAGLLFGRKMIKKYRQQRVMRKQAQTEGNDMPRYMISAPVGHAGFQQQNVRGGSSLANFPRFPVAADNTAFQPRQATGVTLAGSESRQHAAGSKAAEAAEEWEDFPLDDSPPSYKV